MLIAYISRTDNTEGDKNMNHVSSGNNNIKKWRTKVELSRQIKKFEFRAVFILKTAHMCINSTVIMKKLLYFRIAMRISHKYDVSSHNTSDWSAQPRGVPPRPLIGWNIKPPPSDWPGASLSYWLNSRTDNLKIVVVRLHREGKGCCTEEGRRRQRLGHND